MFLGQILKVVWQNVKCFVDQMLNDFLDQLTFEQQNNEHLIKKTFDQTTFNIWSTKRLVFDQTII